MNLDEYVEALKPREPRCAVCASEFRDEVNVGRTKGYTYLVIAEYLTQKLGKDMYPSVKNHFYNGHDSRP